MNGKLVLEKKKDVKGRAESRTTSSDEETEEGQFSDFGLVKGECSKFKSLGKGLKSDGLIQGQQDIGLLDSSEDRLSDSNGQQTEGNISSGDKGLSKSSSQDLGQINKSHNKRFMSSSDSPKQILVRNSEQRGASFSDNDGRLVNLPLTGPIQLPLRDGQGGQIRGKDFIEVPLTVEIEGAGRMEVATKSKFVRHYWSLEEEFTKVIEKGMALGHIVTSKDMKRGGRPYSQVDSEQDQQNDVLRIANSSWNLEEEVTKVIEVAVALGFYFNTKVIEVAFVCLVLLSPVWFLVVFFCPFAGRVCFVFFLASLLGCVNKVPFSKKKKSNCSGRTNNEFIAMY